MDNNFSEVLKNYQNILWPVIEKNIHQSFIIPSHCQIPSEYQSVVGYQQQIILDYPSRKGKYFRPTMLLLTAQSLGVDLNFALPTAAAMQISEDWILNHDDIEDDSPDRRGQPALHKIYGTELALNAGDALHLIMWQALHRNFSLIGNDLSLAIISEFETMLNRTVLGQGIELKWAKDQKYIPNYQDNYLVLESKTGYYTIAGPMRLGAILAGASTQQLDHIYHFGVLLGRTFQIIDDYLDLTSDFSGQKKVKGNDIYEGKKTIMYIHLLQNADSADLSSVKTIFAKSREQKTATDVELIIKLMEKYGSLEYSQKIAADFASQARTIFDNDLTFLKQEPYRSQISTAIDFVANRKF